MDIVYNCQKIEVAINYIDPTPANGHIGIPCTIPGKETVPGNWDVTLQNGRKIRFKQGKVYDKKGKPSEDDIIFEIVGSPITSLKVKDCDDIETEYTTIGEPI